VGVETDLAFFLFFFNDYKYERGHTHIHVYKQVNPMASEFLVSRLSLVSLPLVGVPLAPSSLLKRDGCCFESESTYSNA